MSGMRNVSIIYTGGTIGGYLDQQTGTIKASPSADYLLRTFTTRNPSIKTLANLRVEAPLSLLSEDMIPQDWAVIARTVAREINRGVDGIVVAHGTDTLPFTSAALSLMLGKIPIPVVLTGATYPLDAENTDAVQHLRDSVLVAACDDIAGVYVVFRDRNGDSVVHLGTRVRQIRPFDEHFESVNNDVIGHVRDGSIVLRTDEYDRRSTLTGEIHPDTVIDSNIAFFHVYPGFGRWAIEAAVRRRVRAILLEFYHSGTACTREGEKFMPYSLVEPVRSAVENNIMVFFTHLHSNGRLASLYDSSKQFLEAGAIPLSEMATEAITVKLMWALGHHHVATKIREVMVTNIAGEIASSHLKNTV